MGFEGGAIASGWHAKGAVETNDCMGETGTYKDHQPHVHLGRTLGRSMDSSEFPTPGAPSGGTSTMYVNLLQRASFVWLKLNDHNQIAAAEYKKVIPTLWSDDYGSSQT